MLLADEPTTALDVTVQIQILLLLRELQRELGMAVIFVTHDVGAAVEISDRLAVMYAGRFVETGTARDVIRSAAHPYTRGPARRQSARRRARHPADDDPGAPPNLAALPRWLQLRPALRLLRSPACRAALPPPLVLRRRP